MSSRIPGGDRINPQEVTGWIAHLTNAEYIRSVRDQCEERLAQLNEPSRRGGPLHPKPSPPAEGVSEPEAEMEEPNAVP